MIDMDRSNWGRVRFGDVVANSRETVKDPVGSGLDRVVALEHMEPGNIRLTGWQGAAGGTTFTRRFRAGQTLFAKRRAYQRKVAYAEFDGVCSGDILAFEAKREALLPELLPFIVRSDAFFDNALRTSAGSLSPRTKWQDLATWEFDLPPLDEQNRIAELLWAVERVRLAREREIEKASALELAVLASELDGANVPRVRLDEVVRIQRGLSYRSEDYAEPGQGRPFLTLKSVTRAGHYAEGSLKYLRLEDPGSYVVKPGDLFIANTDLTPGRLLVGAPFFYTGEQASDKPVFSMDLSRLIPVRQDASTEYLHLALRTPAARAFMRANTGGSTVGHLHLKALGGFMVAWPEEPVRRSLVEAMRGVVRASAISRETTADLHQIGQVLSRILWESR